MMKLTQDEVEVVAQACHEVNRAYCIFLGDGSQDPWDDAPQWTTDSAAEGVINRAENPNAPFSASHENWLRHKEADGWAWGDVKDAAKKTHPCMVPYEKLPLAQKRKDMLFSATCKTMFMAMGH